LAEERTTEEERMHIMEGLYGLFPHFLLNFRLICLSPPLSTNTNAPRKSSENFHSSIELIFPVGVETFSGEELCVCGVGSVRSRRLHEVR
jgi:hypothetical protein